MDDVLTALFIFSMVGAIAVAGAPYVYRYYWSRAYNDGFHDGKADANFLVCFATDVFWFNHAYQLGYRHGLQAGKQIEVSHWD